MTSNFLKNLSAEELDINSRIFDLIIGRTFKIAYLKLDQENKNIMEKVFLFGNEKEKEGFVKDNISNFKEIFAIEAKKVEQEIKLEIESQL